MAKKEELQYISKLKKENFNLKLQIYHQNERLRALESKIATADELLKDLKETNTLLDTLYEELKQRDDALDTAATMVIHKDDEIKKLKQDLNTARRDESPQLYTTTLVTTPKKIRWRRHQCLTTTGKDVEGSSTFPTPEANESEEIFEDLALIPDTTKEKQTLSMFQQKTQGNMVRQTSMDSLIFDSPHLSALSENSFVEDLDLELGLGRTDQEGAQNIQSPSKRQSCANLAWPTSHSWTEYYIRHEIPSPPSHSAMDPFRDFHNHRTMMGDDAKILSALATPSPDATTERNIFKVTCQGQPESGIRSMSSAASKIPVAVLKTPPTRIPVSKYGLLTPNLDVSQSASKVDTIQLSSNEQKVLLLPGMSHRFTKTTSKANAHCQS